MIAVDARNRMSRLLGHEDAVRDEPDPVEV
jgi:hypothetical protein